MPRAWVIAAGAIGALAVAVAAGWFLLLRDTARPVSVEEAITIFRTDTEPAPSGRSPIPEGVYVYATDGFEKTDALTGVTHRYPTRSTIAVRAADCGVRLVWRVLEGRSTAWTFCTTPAGWELASQDERHTFFGRTERTTYVCTNTLIRPSAPSSRRWGVSCSTEKVEETGTTSFVGREALQVAGEQVTTEHVRKTSSFTGATRGTSRYDFWFDSQSGAPVRIGMVSRTTNDSPIGDVHYDERVSLLLTSLVPKR